MRRFLFSVLLLITVVPLKASTLATFYTSVGRMQLELYDQDKPVTVSNFISYVTSGRYQNQIVHRWEPGFVIQGGGYRVETSTNPFELLPVQRFEPIVNEYGAGRTFSNTYGTIAMARIPFEIDSASSEWFLNLGDNSFLDGVDEGFTVFGRVIEGTNVLNLFLAPPGSIGIYTNRTVLPGEMPLPLLNTTNTTFNNLLYIGIVLQRDLDLEVAGPISGQRNISWTTQAGITNTLEFLNDFSAGTWQPLTNILGNGSRFEITDPSSDRLRVYRVRLPE